MTVFEQARETLAATLEQPLESLLLVSRDDFVRGEPDLGLSSIGAHVRHVGDAVECLLTGMGNGRIDFDARTRDERLERDPALAVARLRDLALRVRRLDHECCPESVLVSHDAPSDTAIPVAASTPERELIFLASHCVHHWALVGVLMRKCGISPPSQFGVAVSTLRFREGGEVCAR